MYWTYEPPSKKGFYWVKRKSNSDPWVVEVSMFADGPHIYNGSYYVHINNFNYNHRHLFSNKPIKIPLNTIMPTRVERIKRICLGAIPIDYSKSCVER